MGRAASASTLHQILTIWPPSEYKTALIKKKKKKVGAISNTNLVIKP
jgi:hypothetical protein